MARIAEKLKNRQGVSLLIALMYFLVSLTIGTIVLTAATASYGKLSSLRRREQDYLNVSSAARLLRDQIVGSNFTFTITKTETETEDATNTEFDFTSSYDGFSVDMDNENPMRKTMKAYLLGVLGKQSDEWDDMLNCPSVSSKPEISESPIILESIQLDDTSDDSVKGELTLKDSGQILICLWIEEGTGEHVKKRHPVLVTLNSESPIIVYKIEESEESENTPESETEDGAEGDAGTETPFTTTTTITTTYSWKKSGASIHQVTLNEGGGFDETEVANESGGI